MLPLGSVDVSVERISESLKLADNVSGKRPRIVKDLIKLTRGKVYRLTERPGDWLGTIILIVETA